MVDAFAALQAIAPLPRHIGDTDEDGDVDIFDYINLTANYNTSSGATWAMGDFDLDGDVDIFDFQALTSEYGWTEEFLAVPEPTTLFLLGSAAAGILLKRRR